jgi:DNA-binding MarR family transcriptional regulator
MKEQKLETGTGFLLNEVSRLLRREFDRRAQHLGLTQTQWRTLAYLSVNEGISQVALADMLEIQPISLARLIDRLQAAGWVERRPDPNDRRAFKLFLVPETQPLIEQIRLVGAETRAAALQGVSKAAQKQLTDILQSMKLNLLNQAALDQATTNQTINKSNNTVIKSNNTTVNILPAGKDARSVNISSKGKKNG